MKHDDYDYVEKHEGPWPLDPERVLDCDECGAELSRQRDVWLAYTNPYGPYGWTLLCGPCSAKEKVSVWRAEG